MDFITRSCSDAIRLCAGSDKFIAARDVSGYVQMVLAPELATRLVMEDMNVDIERARGIMGESVDLGDLLSGGADSDIPIPSSDAGL
jgi:RTC4-like domain